MQMEAGKDDQEKNWKEISLIRYKNGKWYDWEKFPFDLAVTDIFPRWNQWEADKYLRRELKRLNEKN